MELTQRIFGEKIYKNVYSPFTSAIKDKWPIQSLNITEQFVTIVVRILFLSLYFSDSWGSADGNWILALRFLGMYVLWISSALSS